MGQKKKRREDEVGLRPQGRTTGGLVTDHDINISSSGR